MTTTTPGLFGRTAARVNEPPPYRFDGHPGAYEFSTDLLAAVRGDSNAHVRLNRALPAVFAVSTGDNPAVSRSSSAPYAPATDSWGTPIWDYIERPAPWPADAPAGPITYPSLASSSGVVGDHTEGIEPADATIVTTGPTLAATLVSGRIDLGRQVYDSRVGSPNLSLALRTEIDNSFRAALEARAAATLAAIASPITIALSGVAVNAALTTALRAAVVPLSKMRAGFTGSKLHQALSVAEDTQGRTLLEAIEDDRGDGVKMAGRALRLSPALPSGVSWMLGADALHGFTTGPREMILQSLVKEVTLAVTGYAAVPVIYPGNIRKITY